MLKCGKIVISSHDWPHPHWDMFVDFDETTERVATWSLDQLPGLIPASGQATKLADHRRIYLTYEGEVSEGRGQVTIACEGDFETEDAENGKELELKLKLNTIAGKSISGLITLIAIETAIDQNNGRSPVLTKNAWRWSWKPL